MPASSKEIKLELSPVTPENGVQVNQRAAVFGFHTLAVAGLILLYLLLAGGLSLTKAPVCDEGWYADPAVNLLKNGSMGSPVLEGKGSFLKGIEKHTYHEMPVYIVVQAGWYKLFGASLFSMRALSMMAGLIALISWYTIILKANGRKNLALLVFLLAELDFIFINLATTGRSDMLSLAFGAAAQALYLVLRTRNFHLALLFAHALVAASGLTHPVGGLASLAAILFLHLTMDRDRFRLSELLVVAVPYLMGSLCWGLYAMQSPDDFWSQFRGNSSERLWPLQAPLLAIEREALERFIGGYRTGSSSWTPLANLRLLVLVAYLSGLLFLALHRRVRQGRLGWIVLAQAALTVLILLFFEGSKQPWYLVHLTLPFTAALGMALEWCWRQQTRYRTILIVFTAGVLGIEVGYPALIMLRNNYRNSYLPAVSVLKNRATKPRSVMGSAELGFGLGFDKVTDDHFLSYYTHREPGFIVVDSNYRSFLKLFRRENPQVCRYFESLLAHKYNKIYANEHYTIWSRQ